MEYDLGRSYATPNPSRDKKAISLSIEDLMTDTDTAKEKTISAVNVDSEGIDYKNELAKLLAKSRGTAYEKTLKRFVESKYREIQQDESERTRKALAGQLDLASLSTSKYDSPRKSSILEDSVLNSNRKSKIEEMSKPLERNLWKGPENPASLVSTNLIGRQRPSPMKDAPYALHSNSNSLIVTANSVVRSTHSPDRRQPQQQQHRSSGRSRSSRRVRSRSPQLQSNHQQLAASPAAPSVTSSEFNSWLDQNRLWQQQKKDKIEKERRRFEKRLAEEARPMLYAKSVKLAEEVNLRESQRLVEAVEARNQQLMREAAEQRDQMMMETDLLSEFDLPLDDEFENRSTTSTNTATTTTTAVPPPAPLSPSAITVYDRLAARGRSYAEQRLHWEPPDDQQPHRPVILEASLRLLRNRSPSPYYMRASASLSPSRHSNYLRGSGMSRVLATAATATSAAAYAASNASEATATSGVNATAGGVAASVHSEGGDTAEGPPHKTRSDSKLTVHSTTSSATSEAVHSFVVSSSLKLSDLLNNNNNNNIEEQEQQREGRSEGREDSRRRSRSRERSASCDRLRLLAQAGIERSRSLSASRRRKEVERECRRTFSKPPPVEGATTTAATTIGATAPFTPRMTAASESSRILSRATTTSSSFQERNLLSVENKFIRNVISKRAGSPGPGYYSNLHKAALVLSPSRVGPSSSREASPGRGGYSFNREPLQRLNHHKAAAAVNINNNNEEKVTELMDTLTELGNSLRLKRSSSKQQLDSVAE